MFEGEKWEKFKARDDLRKLRKITVIITLIFVALSSVLFVRMRHYEAAFETARQNHIWDILHSLSEFESIFQEFYRLDTEDFMLELRQQNVIFIARTRALGNHHDRNIGETFCRFWGFRFISPYGNIYNVGTGFPFMRTDAPEVLIRNRLEMQGITRQLRGSIHLNMDTYDVLLLVVAAKGEINEFFR